MSHFDFSFFTTAFVSNYLLKGLYFSVIVTIVATIFGFLFGTFLAMARLARLPILPQLATIYITVMRAIPLVLVILWFFLIFPDLFEALKTPHLLPLIAVIENIVGNPINMFLSAVLTFVAFEAAYFAEIMRAGINAIPQGQMQAGDALGMRYLQKMLIIILPQAFRTMLPVLLTQVIILFQDTSLVYVIGGYDLLKGFEVGGSIWGQKSAAYILAACTYFIICFALSQIVRNLQKKVAIIR